MQSWKWIFQNAAFIELEKCKLVSNVCTTLPQKKLTLTANANIMFTVMNYRIYKTEARCKSLTVKSRLFVEKRIKPLPQCFY